MFTQIYCVHRFTLATQTYLREKKGSTWATPPSLRVWQAHFGPTTGNVHPRLGLAQFRAVKLGMEMQIGTVQFDSQRPQVPVEKPH